MENVGLMVALAGAMTKAPSSAQVASAVDAWLYDHPEATTTVQDGAITNAKLATSFVTPGTASAYSSSATYAVGDYVFYGGALYRCTTAITTAESWTAAHWTAAVLGDDVSDLKSAFDTEEHKSDNLLDISKIETGCYYWTNGKNVTASYNATPLIPVEEGQRIICQYGGENAASRQMVTQRFVVGYDENGDYVSGSEKGNAYGYTVPAGVHFIRSSVVANVLKASQNVSMFVSADNTIVDYIPYFDPYTELILKDTANSEQTKQNTNDISVLKEQNGVKNAIFTATADSLAANTNLICCNSCDNKKNEYIELTAHFSSFGELTIAHGKGSYMGMYITITSDKIKIYAYDDTLIEEYDHGLTLSDFINVIIYTKNDSSCRSKISIMSAGGDYAVETSRYYSCRAAVLCNATFAMTDVQMKYTVNDAKEAVWVFGDSYISLGDPNRWATLAVQDGHIKMMIHGFGGATSMNEIVPFRALLDVARPKFIVWALGMNDGDTSAAVNTDWKTCVDEVIATCESNGITLILATIPNVPNVRNTFKNAYVKSTGLRYVDFAKAVNAESAGATWYTGMLSSDNTHPTALGAKALMRQFLQDVPEVLYAED